MPALKTVVLATSALVLSMLSSIPLANGQATFPKLGFPCMATSNDTVFLGGLEQSVAAAGQYNFGVYSAPLKGITTASSFTSAALSTGTKINLLGAASRTLCAVDENNHFMYMFQNTIGIVTSATTAPVVVNTWQGPGGGPQVLWSKGGGTFGYLGYINGTTWEQYDISLTGVSTKVAFVPPAGLPALAGTTINSLTRSENGSFLIVYPDAQGYSASMRFILGAASTTNVVVDSVVHQGGYNGFAHMSKGAMDYFFTEGTSGSNTFILTIQANATNMVEYTAYNTKTAANVDLYMYPASTMLSTTQGLIYGGLFDAGVNAWSFTMVLMNIDATNTNPNLLTNFAAFPASAVATTGTNNVGQFPAYVAPLVPANEASSGLSTGAIIGIAAGAVVLILVIILAVFLYRRGKKIDKKTKEEEHLDMAVRGIHEKKGNDHFQPRFGSNHSLINSSEMGRHTSTSTNADQHHQPPPPPPENLTLRVPIMRYDGADVAQSVPNAPIGAVVLSQYRLGQTTVQTSMVTIQSGENVDTAESVTLKWVLDEIVWQREAAMLNHIVNPSKVISLHQTMIIPSALDWRHILVEDAIEISLDQMLYNNRGRPLNRVDQMAIAKALVGGLVWCHEKDVIHLSVSTNCLVLNEEGLWVLWSFGGARFLNEAIGHQNPSALGQVDPNAVSRNMAPEVLNARRERRMVEALSTAAMDAWACGCVLFEVYTGQPLFRTLEAAEQAATGRFNAWKDRLNEIQDYSDRRVVEGLLVLDPLYRMTLADAQSELLK